MAPQTLILAAVFLGVLNEARLLQPDHHQMIAKKQKDPDWDYKTIQGEKKYHKDYPEHDQKSTEGSDKMKAGDSNPPGWEEDFVVDGPSKGHHAHSDKKQHPNEWYAEEKKRIDEDCDKRLQQLEEEHKRRLRDEVDAARHQWQKAEDEVKKAESDVDKENEHLTDAEKRAKKEQEEANRKRNKIDEYEDTVKGQQDKINAMKEEIERKKACVEELRQAQQDLLDAQKRLAQLKGGVDDSKSDSKAQDLVAKKEEGDVRKEEDDLAEAQEALAKAKARADAAEDELKRIKKKADEELPGEDPCANCPKDGVCGVGISAAVIFISSVFLG